MPCKLQLFVFMSQWLNNFFCRKVKSEVIKKVISFVNMLCYRIQQVLLIFSYLLCPCILILLIMSVRQMSS